MDFPFYIAKRYLISKKSNNAINIISWISIVAIAVTTGALIIILSAMNGLTGTVANLYNTLEPDIKITTDKQKYFVAGEDMLKKIKSVAGINRISSTLSDKALVKNIDKQCLVTVKGVDAEFNLVTSVDSAIIEGAYSIDTPAKNRIVLGRGIANQLQVNMNDFVNEVSLYSPIRGKAQTLNPEDNLNQIYCTPCGIFSLNDEFDYQFAFVNIETARKLFDNVNQVSALELSCEKDKLESALTELKDKLGNDFVIKNRYQLNDVLFKSLETEKLATFIILSFILVIATFNIIGALTMLIIEKKKDIKTLYSLGADIKLIRGIFMREGFLITGVGAILGLLLGLFVCWLQMEFHLVKFGNGSEFIIPYYPIELQFKDFIWILISIMVIGFFAALYPVRVFTKTDLVH